MRYHTAYFFCDSDHTANTHAHTVFACVSITKVLIHHSDRRECTLYQLRNFVPPLFESPLTYNSYFDLTRSVCLVVSLITK